MVTADGGATPPEGQAGPRSPSLHILHFNDVYNVEEQKEEPMAGAARFKTAFDSFKKGGHQYQGHEPLVLFSGDIFAPSIMSTFTKGEQMVPVLNMLGVHCAVYGNHDFDFGLERLVELAGKTTFPWMMSNVVDNETNRPLAEGRVSLTLQWNGWKIGLVGLVEREWLDTLATINSDEVTFTDYVDAGTQLAKQLKAEGCDLVVALTHMRTPNDLRLAENVDEIDLILGGHDHVYEITHVNGKYIIKSGTDFRQFSHIVVTAETGRGGGIAVTINRHDVTAANYAPDPELATALLEYEGVIGSKMDEVLGVFSVELDGLFSSIRTKETNLGNFVCDIIMAACNADVAVLNSGTLRSDRIHPQGEFTMRDLMTILPMLDSLCVLEVTGAILLAILENGVSQYPKLEGRFPQVAGVQFVFDPTAPVGARIIRDLVKIGDEYLQEDHKYRMCTKAYMRQGRDGYTMLVDCPVLQDDEQCPLLSTAVQNHFAAIRTRQNKTRRRNSTHHQSLLLLSRRHSLIRCDDDNSNGAPRSLLLGNTPAVGARGARNGGVSRSVSTDSSSSCASSTTIGSSTKKMSRQESFQELEEQACKLAPCVDQRIILAGAEEVEALRQKRLLHRNVSIIQEEDDEPSTPTTPAPPAAIAPAALASTTTTPLPASTSASPASTTSAPPASTTSASPASTTPVSPASTTPAQTQENNP